MTAVTAKRLAVALLLAWTLPLPARQDDKPAPRRLTRAEQEEFLRTAEVKNRRTLGEGVTESERLTLEKDGFRHDAHFQKIEESKTNFESTRGSEMNFKDSWKFNVAAYELAKLLGIADMIPPSVERKFGGNTGAMTWWIDDVAMDEKKRVRDNVRPPNPTDWNEQMLVVRVFDQLIYNTDRNLGNLIISQDWKLWMIDHTRAFRTRTDLLGPKNLRRCDRNLLARLRELDKPALQKSLQRYLVGTEMQGLLARSRAIVKLFDAATKEKGEAAVLYDRAVRE
jgi:hypothetical protein